MEWKSIDNIAGNFYYLSNVNVACDNFFSRTAHRLIGQEKHFTVAARNFILPFLLTTSELRWLQDLWSYAACVIHGPHTLKQRLIEVWSTAELSWHFRQRVIEKASAGACSHKADTWQSAGSSWITKENSCLHSVFCCVSFDKAVIHRPVKRCDFVFVWFAMSCKAWKGKMRNNQLHIWMHNFQIDIALFTKF